MNTIQSWHGHRWLLLAGASSLAVAAQAADPVAQANGVMSFANVNVVAAPVAPARAPAAANARKQPGLMAFIDPATGQLLQPSAEMAATLAPPPAAAVSLRKAAVVTNASFELPQGGVGMMLDDSQASFFVAQRGAQGGVELSCLPGEQTAKTRLKASSPVKSRFAAAKGEVK